MNTTQTAAFVAGFAEPLCQLASANVRAAFSNGRAGVPAVPGDAASTAGTNTDGLTVRGRGFDRSRLPLTVSESLWTVIGDAAGNGGGVPAETELAPERGKPMAEHAAATQRRYGASGKRPRKIPA